MIFKFKNKGIFISILMIRLGNIETPASRQSNYIYRDLHLDLELDNKSTGQSVLAENPISATDYTDIKQSVNEGAIKNSLTNLFNTFPGQKLLNPEYGLDLGQYLFSPASKSIAQQIGDDILRGIERYEPRVTVININVGVDFDNHEYEISLSIGIPKLSNLPVNMTGILHESNFTFK
jgi:phage baseplate assembly protein W